MVIIASDNEAGFVKYVHTSQSFRSWLLALSTIPVSTPGSRVSPLWCLRFRCLRLSSRSPTPCVMLVEVVVEVAAVDVDAKELASNDVGVGRSRHMMIESRPLEAATARFPLFTASSA